MSARRWQQFVDDRGTIQTDNRPPNHGKATNPDAAARFLEWAGKLDREVSVENLGELYQEWRERQDTGEQANLSGWSE